MPGMSSFCLRGRTGDGATLASARTGGIRRLRSLVVAAFAGTLLAVSGEAHAQVRGLIVGPGETAFPIAVSPLRSDASSADLGDRFAEVVSRDLDFSGLFRLLDRGSFIEDPQKSGVTAEEINFGDWSTIGARLLVKGTCSVHGDDLDLEARLFDVAERRQLGGKRYHGSRADVRRMGHRFADEILQVLTGERGPFDSRIAFISRRGGRFKELYVMSFDGQDLKQLTRNQTINLSPSWSPDNRSVLFTSYQDGRPRLYEIEVSSGRQRLLSALPGATYGARFSPDGGSIAVAREVSPGNTDIVLMNPAGEVLRKLASSEGIDVSPSWSPDGRSFAFCSSRGGSPQIYVGGLDGGAPRRLTFSGSYNTSPAWSPKGDRIAYVGRVGGTFQIFTIAASGGEPLTLTSSRGDNVDPSWSPDGRYIMFSSSRGGREQLFVMDARGEHEKQLTTGPGGDSSPAWSSRLE